MATSPKDLDYNQPQTLNRSATRSVLMITSNQVEDLEFFYPYYRFLEAGYKVDVATPKGGEFKGKHEIGLKTSMKVADIDAEDYEMLYLPGGKAPAELKKDENVIALTKRFVELAKPIAAVCHGPQILAAADVIKGHKITAWPEVEEEVREAGATYVDQEVLVDGRFVTARWPGDLPAHMKETLTLLNKNKSAQKTQQAA